MPSLQAQQQDLWKQLHKLMTWQRKYIQNPKWYDRRLVHSKIRRIKTLQEELEAIKSKIPNQPLQHQQLEAA